jgi:hypothetical protein
MEPFCGFLGVFCTSGLLGGELPRVAPAAVCWHLVRWLVAPYAEYFWAVCGGSVVLPPSAVHRTEGRLLVSLLLTVGCTRLGSSLNLRPGVACWDSVRE